MGDSFLEQVGVLDNYLEGLRSEMQTMYELRNLNANYGSADFQEYVDLTNHKFKEYWNLEDINFLIDKIKYINSSYESPFKEDGDGIIDIGDKLHELYDELFNIERQEGMFCDRNCMGYCDYGCQAECENTCDKSCLDGCDIDCSSICAYQCELYCAYSCQENCYSMCTSYCDTLAGHLYEIGDPNKKGEYGSFYHQ